jgi:hypothetical protein
VPRYALINLHVDYRSPTCGNLHCKLAHQYNAFLITQHCFKGDPDACPIDCDTIEVDMKHDARKIALDLAEMLVIGGSAKDVRVYFRNEQIAAYAHDFEQHGHQITLRLSTWEKRDA